MTGYVADLSWKSGVRAIEKLDRLRPTMAVKVLNVGHFQLHRKLTHTKENHYCCYGIIGYEMAKLILWSG